MLGVVFLFRQLSPIEIVFNKKLKNYSIEDINLLSLNEKR